MEREIQRGEREFVERRIEEYREEEDEEGEEESQRRVVIPGEINIGSRQGTFPFWPPSSFPSSSSSSSSLHYQGVSPAGYGLARWGAAPYEAAHQGLSLGVANLNHIDAMDTNTASSHRSSDEDDRASVSVEREHMFDKVVTPSDVGKLNRLVIPKQHAEKYFPLDSAANEKGLLLNFEDRSGKPWRFRYSYWNSSQSYVMTKGWSRFVKEKKLDAGDIVSFERGVGESGKDRLYIDWKRRPDGGHRIDPSSMRGLPLPHPLSFHRSVPWGGLFFPPTVSMSSMQQSQIQLQQQHQQQQQQHQLNYEHNYGYNVVNPASVFYLRSAGPQAVQHIDRDEHAARMPVVFESVPVAHGKATTGKRLRLFGVNLECPTSEESSSNVYPSTTIPHSIASLFPQPQAQPQPQPQSPPLQLRLHGSSPRRGSNAELPQRPKPPVSFDFGI